MNTFEKGQEYIMNTYGRFPLAFVHGEGMYITDEDGKTYLDFVAGIATNCLGHGHKKLAAAVAEQAQNLIHCSNLYWTKPQTSLAEKLVQNSCFDKVFFCNSGAEAVEALLKLARKYGGQTNRYEIITMEHSFHGRTMGALSATGQTKYQKGFAPLVPHIKHVPFNNFDALRKAVSRKTCAVLLEPIQGEGGIRPADVEYLQKVRRLCSDEDILLMFDEIQCGIGRTGSLFAYQHFGVEPDAVALAKGLGGGVPIGAMLAAKKCSATLGPGEHASTFGGNPLATAAGNVVLDELTGGVVANAKIMGAYLREQLLALQKDFSCVVDVRGVGLLQGIELNKLAAPVVKTCIDNGLLLVNAGTNVVRFVPALIVEKKHIDDMIAILRGALSA